MLIMPAEVRCTLPWSQIKFEPGDQVRVCCWAREPLGKLEEFPDLESAWNGEAMRRFRRKMLEGKHAEICNPACPYLVNGTYASERFQVPENSFSRRSIQAAIREGLEEVEVPPLRIEASLDDRCALKCVMCSWNSGRYRIHPNFYAMMGEAGPGLEEFEILGGEPFYSKQVIDFLKHAAENQPPYRFAFTTSLSHLPLPLLEKVRIAWIIASIDGATQETYEAIRVGGNWENVLRNLNRLLALRDRAAEWYLVQVNFTVMTLNFPEIPDAVRLFNEMGVPAAFYKVGLMPTDLRDPFQHPVHHEPLKTALMEGIRESRHPQTKTSLEGLLAVLNDFRTTYDHAPC